jgi:hypothetical protein
VYLTMSEERMERVRRVTVKVAPRERSESEWEQIQVVIVKVLDDFPAAREAVVAALERVLMKEQAEDSRSPRLLE